MLRKGEEGRVSRSRGEGVGDSLVAGMLWRRVQGRKGIGT